MHTIDTIDCLYELFLQSRGITTDTRRLEQGTIFFALKGENFDGNAYALQALEKGSSYAVVDPSFTLPENTDPSVDDRLWVAPKSTLLTLQDLARKHRSTLGIPVIAITGTNGKTTTKELVTQVLSAQYQVRSTVGNLNNSIGVPLTLLSLTPEDQIAVVEMGASHIGDIRELVDIALPNYGIITNIGKAHLLGFGSFDGVKQTKGELYDYIRQTNGTLFVSSDDTILTEMAEGIEQVGYGSSEANAVSGKVDEAQSLDTLAFRWHRYAHPDKEYSVSTHLVGRYNLPNLLCAVCVGCYFDVSELEICKALSSYQPTNQRSQLIPCSPKHNTLIVDAYNANPSSMQVAVSNLFSQATHHPERVLILGDMNELGDASEQEHTSLVRNIVAQVGNQRVKVLLAGSQFFRLRSLCDSYPYIRCFETTEQVKQYLETNSLSDALVLLKGSRSMKIETLVELC